MQAVDADARDSTSAEHRQGLAYSHVEASWSASNAALAAMSASLVGYLSGPQFMFTRTLPWRLPLALAVLGGLAALVAAGTRSANRRFVGTFESWKHLAVHSIVLVLVASLISGALSEGVLRDAPLFPALLLAPACLLLCALPLWLLRVAVAKLGVGSLPSSRWPLTVAFLCFCVALREKISWFAQWDLHYLRPFVLSYAATVALAGAIWLAGLSHLKLRRLGHLGLALLALVFFAGAHLTMSRLYPNMHVAAWLAGVVAAARLPGVSKRLPSALTTKRWRSAPWVVGAVSFSMACVDSRLRFELLETHSGLPVAYLFRALEIKLGPLFLPLGAGLPEPPGARSTNSAGVSSSAASTGPPSTHDAGPPSVALILVDALRADHFTVDLMPRTRAWVRSGASFGDARSPVPRTVDAVRGAVSGRLQSRPSARRALPCDRSVICILGARGYRTSHFGFDDQLSRKLGCAFDHELLTPFKPVSWSRKTTHQIVEAFAREVSDTSAPKFAILHLGHTHAPYDPFAPSPGDRPIARYQACVRDVDGILDMVLSRLDGIGEQRPLITVLFSDHGEEFGDHGGAYHGTTVYDEQVRVVLAFGGAGVSPGTHGQTVSLLDIGPTIMDKLGLDPLPKADGRSLLPLLEGGTLPAQPALSEVIDRGLTARASTLGRHKLITNYFSGTLELYDLAADPEERNNLLERVCEVPRVLLEAQGLDRRAHCGP